MRRFFAECRHRYCLALPSSHWSTRRQMSLSELSNEFANIQVNSVGRRPPFAFSRPHHKTNTAQEVLVEMALGESIAATNLGKLVSASAGNKTTTFALAEVTKRYVGGTLFARSAEDAEPTGGDNHRANRGEDGERESAGGGTVSRPPSTLQFDSPNADDLLRKCIVASRHITLDGKDAPWVHQFHLAMMHWLGRRASEISAQGSAWMLHYLVMQSTMDCPSIVATLVDNILVNMKDVSSLPDLSLVLDAIARRQSMVLRLTLKLEKASAANDGTLARYDDPVLNEKFYLAITDQIAAAVISRPGEASVNLKVRDALFLCRALSKIEWINKACVVALLPSMSTILDLVALNSVTGVVFLLGRRDLHVVDEDLTEKLIATLQALLDGRLRRSRGDAPLGTADSSLGGTSSDNSDAPSSKWTPSPFGRATGFGDFGEDGLDDFIEQKATSDTEDVVKSLAARTTHKEMDVEDDTAGAEMSMPLSNPSGVELSLIDFSQLTKLLHALSLIVRRTAESDAMKNTAADQAAGKTAAHLQKARRLERFVAASRQVFLSLLDDTHRSDILHQLIEMDTTAQRFQFGRLFLTLKSIVENVPRSVSSQHPLTADLFVVLVHFISHEHRPQVRSRHMLNLESISRELFKMKLIEVVNGSRQLNPNLASRPDCSALKLLVKKANRIRALKAGKAPVPLPGRNSSGSDDDVSLQQKLDALQGLSRVVFLKR